MPWAQSCPQIHVCSFDQRHQEWNMHIRGGNGVLVSTSCTVFKIQTENILHKVGSMAQWVMHWPQSYKTGVLSPALPLDLGQTTVSLLPNW